MHRKLLGGLALVALFGVLGVQAQKCKPAGTPCDPQGPSWQCCTGVCTNGGVCGLREQDEGDNRACRPPGARCGPGMPKCCRGECGRDKVCPRGRDEPPCSKENEQCDVPFQMCCSGLSCGRFGRCEPEEEDVDGPPKCLHPGDKCVPGARPICCFGTCREGVCEYDDKLSPPGRPCIKPGQSCEISGRPCCKDRCKYGTCPGNGPTPKGTYDLQPQDLNALCPKVDRNYRAPSDCVYMKWVPCSGGQSDPNRPCGWYQQTKCGDNSNDNGGPNKPNIPEPRFLDFEKDRKKRSADEKQQDEEVDNGPVFISFQE